MKSILACSIALIWMLPTISESATELVRLTPATWDEYAPAGKEVDCIYGDYVLRNGQIIVVIAQPLPTRNANMTVRNNGAMIIDLTRRDAPNDQLSVYHPNGMELSFHSPDRVATMVDGKEVDGDEIARGGKVEWRCSTTAASGLEVTVRYELEDGSDVLKAETVIHNPTAEKVEFTASDYIRADRTFAFGNDTATGLFWAHDDWFAQAYGVVVEGATLKPSGSRGSVLEIQREGNAKSSLAANDSTTISRSIFPGASLLAVRGIANRINGIAAHNNTIRVFDKAGPVVHARLTVSLADQEVGSARTDADGEIRFETPQGVDEFKYVIEASGERRVEGTHAVLTKNEVFSIELQELGYVASQITDESGKPIPCKVAFHGLEGTATPDFGPDSGAVGVKNLHYSHNGRFHQPLGPGKYEVIVSFGPEYDAVFKTIEVARGETTELSAKLNRVVDTTGWVSGDFHSHSTPSGDNTSMQLGRVLNLLCENVEFCPCTEHNRISSYVPHLKELGVEHLMATCSGMELTGGLLPVNHQNAFPLKYTPRTQDGGGPVTDTNPVAQIERLAFWDDKSDKLVQENHPNLYQIIGDKDLNDEPDGGFEAMFGFMDVIEVHPLETIFSKPEKDDKGRLSRNPIYHWMQMLNLGYRIPGVVNTDAHYNYHESGWLRNYLKSPTDDPAKIDTMEMVHASEAGHVTMTTGPFMEVVLKPQSRSITPSGIPGDDVIVPGGKATLSVRVQCSNWLDVNRVQVFVNGRPREELNFTRRETPAPFSDGVVKFESDIPIELSEDAHIIVATIGEGLQLGRVMGPLWGGQTPPVAVSNPIFVDIDGDGFKPNGDLLDVPLPLSK